MEWTDLFSEINLFRDRIQSEAQIFINNLYIRHFGNLVCPLGTDLNRIQFLITWLMFTHRHTHSDSHWHEEVFSLTFLCWQLMTQDKPSRQQMKLNNFYSLYIKWVWLGQVQKNDWNISQTEKWSQRSEITSGIEFVSFELLLIIPSSEI